MTEKLFVPGLNDDETVTLNLLVEQLAEKSKRNRLRSSFYDGKKAVKQVAGGSIPPQYTKLATALGWAAKGVDGLARRCNIDGFVWADGDLESLGMQELEDSNFLLSELSQGRTDSLIHGTSFLITTRGLGDEPKALVHAKDARNATGEWNVRKRRLDNLLSITSRDDDKITGFVLYLDGVTITADRPSGVWEVSRSEHPWHVPAEPLIYKPRSSRRFGRSRITRAVMSHQMSALRALVRLEAHMDIYAIAKLVLLGANESVFKNADGSYKDSWQVVMGRVFGLPDDEDAHESLARADVKQLSAQSPEPHLADLNALAKLMARETDLPDSDFALTDMSNPTSADAYNASRENLIAEAEGASEDWSVPIRRTVTRALAIQNDLEEVPASWRGIQPAWRSPIYLSKSQQADAGAKQLSLVPWLAETPVGLKMLGLSQQDIDLAMAEKRKQAGRALVASIVKPAEVPADGDSE
ncbi:phage portal protein [Agromyces sp. NBRC 114283]|uniref:phage portal protein n=1 Tax=Agromyces sp. NBRC 114283 TaxID=2994521 RepID=UPI0024A2EB76|nr:phage portal protein [Agromyces sp. NBRC 114283]GLU88944.1 hypothetical protein Agsp01_11990 [Agromyces sp. NBRC 114283]